MTLLPVYIDGDISQGELKAALESVGYMLRVEGHRMVVTRVPAFLRHTPEIAVAPPPEAEIIPMHRPAKKGSR